MNKPNKKTHGSREPEQQMPEGEGAVGKGVSSLVTERN